MEIVDAIMDQLAQTGAGILPSGGAAWLRTHPKKAHQLYEDLLELKPHEYVEFAFAIVAPIWGEDEDNAAERLGYQLYELGQCADVSLRWTGRWRIAAIPWDYLPAASRHPE